MEIADRALKAFCAYFHLSLLPQSVLFQHCNIIFSKFLSDGIRLNLKTLKKIIFLLYVVVLQMVCIDNINEKC